MPGQEGVVELAVAVLAQIDWGAVQLVLLAMAGIGGAYAGITTALAQSRGAKSKDKVDTITVGKEYLEDALARADQERAAQDVKLDKMREQLDQQRANCDQETAALRQQIASLSRRMSEENEQCLERVRVMSREIQRLRTQLNGS